MAKASESQLKAAVLRVMELKPQPTISQLVQPPQISTLRRTLGNRLETVFGAAGLDIKKINEMLADHQTAVRHVLEKQKAQAQKDFPNRAKHYRQNIDKLARTSVIQGNSIALTTPYYIAATTIDMLKEYHIEKRNNYGKIQFGDPNDRGWTYKQLAFYFAWQSPGATIQVNADVIAQGFCQVNAMPGLFSGGSGQVDVTAQLKVHVVAENYVIFDSPSQTTQIAYKIANGGIGIFGGDSDLELAVIDGTYLVSVPARIIGRDEIIVFEVALVIGYTNDNSGILVDFWSENGFVGCPAVVVNIIPQPATSTTSTMSRRKPTRTKTKKADRTSKSKSTRKKRRKG